MTSALRNGPMLKSASSAVPVHSTAAHASGGLPSTVYAVSSTSTVAVKASRLRRL